MRILIYGINYDPELTGIGKYTGQMAKWLAANQHDVTVITAMPYYPEWQIHSKYKGRLWHSEMVEGVKIYRSPLYVPQHVNAKRRIIHEMSFLLSIFPLWFITIFQRKYDIVMYVSPPFHLGIWPYLYAKIRRAKFITHVQDLQVDAAKNLGMIKNERLLNWLFKAENFVLRNSDWISTISTGMKRKIQEKSINATRISIVNNSVDTTNVIPLTKEQSMLSEFDLNLNDKVILYSGNVGEKQGLELVIEAAKRFRQRTELKFLIVGSGAAKEKLMTLCQQEQCKNVYFFPLQPYEKLSELMAVADVHLILQKEKASDLLMPSKLSTILAAGGCPIVSAVAGTSLYEIIDDHSLGILIKPECVDALCEGIEIALVSDLDAYKANARLFAENYLTTEKILGRFEAELNALVRPRHLHEGSLAPVES